MSVIGDLLQVVVALANAGVFESDFFSNLIDSDVLSSSGLSSESLSSELFGSSFAE